MRLLGMNCRFRFYLLAVLALTGQVSADEQCKKNMNSIHNITVCVQSDYNSVDKILNEQYGFLIRELPLEDKLELKSTQNTWIKFRDTFCEYRHGGEDQGREAAIEKIVCLTTLAGSRVTELVSLRSKFIIDGFNRAVDAVRYKKPEWLSYSESLQYFGTSIPSKEWKEYAEKNCRMTLKLELEDKEKCMARMRFHIPIT